MGMKRIPTLILAMILATTLATTVYAQIQGRGTPPRANSLQPAPNMSNAFETRQRLEAILREYPPFLSAVLKLDPSLLTNETFLAPYPNIAEFLMQHPEITQNPSFFVGSLQVGRFNSWDGGFREETPAERSRRFFEMLMGGLAAFTGGIILLSVLTWAVKTFIDHRRWLRISKVQSEVHSKLLDRFTSNQDLLAYVQSPAGRHFLESAPIALDPGARAVGAPLSRILFSVQAGTVLAVGGLGLHLVSQSLTVDYADVAQSLSIVGIFALALGIGFVLSAVVSYALSRRLGLLDQPTVPAATPGNNAGVSPPNA